MDNFEFTAAKPKVSKPVGDYKKSVLPREKCPCRKEAKTSALLRVEESETGVTVIIGGTEKGPPLEYVIGGWSEYEINRRHYRSGDYYPGRSYITPEDAIYSILGGGPNLPFKREAEKFANVLERLRSVNYLFEKNGKAVLICLEPEDVREIAQSTPLIEDLKSLSDEATVLAKSFGLHLQNLQPSVVPDISTSSRSVKVSVSDKEKVRALEREIRDHAATLEKYRAEVTSRLHKVSSYLTSLLPPDE